MNANRRRANTTGADGRALSHGADGSFEAPHD